MNIKKITMQVKRVQYQEVIVTEENGFDMPKDVNALLSLCESLKQDPDNYSDDYEWKESEDGIQIVDFKVEEGLELNKGE